MGKVQDYLSKIQSLSFQVKEANEEINTQNSIAKLEKEEAYGRIVNFKEKIAQLEADNISKDSKLAFFQDELSTKTTKFSETEKKNTERISSLETQNTEYVKQNRELQRKLAQIFMDCDDLKNSFETEREKDFKLIDDLRLDLNDCDVEIRSYKKQVKELTKKLQEVSESSHTTTK